MVQATQNGRVESLGPAESIINTLVGYADHMLHNRPGVVIKYPNEIGLEWFAATYKEENGTKTVYKLEKRGRKTMRVPFGNLGVDNKTVLAQAGEAVVGEYRGAGIFPEVAVWMYQRVADVWKMDNEFAARWASYAFEQPHRDMKVILAAFMLCQSRKGDPVMENGKVAFKDDDFRDVGEAMMLLMAKDKDLNPRLLLRIHDVLVLPGVAEINRKLGFTKSARNPFLGRWTKAVEKWLSFREQNPKLLEGLVKAGFRRSVMQLCQHVGYKPSSERFFQALRWKQAQAKDGRRSVAIGKEVAPAVTWEGLTEQQICERITREKMDYKRITGLLPKSIGLTRAIMAAAIEAGCLSNKEMIIFSPTIEDLGLMDVQEIREKWQAAVKVSEDQRAANIATRMKSTAAKETLQEGADNAIKKAVEEVTKGMRVYFMVDISGSMQSCIEEAKVYIAKFLQGFPSDRVHVSVFNTSGRELPIRIASAAGVENAFRGLQAGGGTDYGAGVLALRHRQPAADEDVLFFFVGDEEASQFEHAVTISGLRPTAFGFVKIGAFENGYSAVRDTAALLGIPCFIVNPKTFEDPYAVQRTIRNLIASTPISKTVMPQAWVRQSLIDLILKTDLLAKPVWA